MLNVYRYTIVIIVDLMTDGASVCIASSSQLPLRVK